MKAQKIEKKILTKHPLGKSGKNISQDKYELAKKTILTALRTGQLTHTELFAELNKSLASKFTGNINWYGETVKSIWKRGKSLNALPPSRQSTA